MPGKFLCIIIALSFLFLPVFAEDTLTITTYYPSPYGVYRELRAKRIAIGDDYIQGGTYDWESTDGDGGEIDYDADLVVEGNVGIGTVNPASLLDLRTGSQTDTLGAGTIKLGIGSANEFWAFRQSATPIADLSFDAKYSGTWSEVMRIQRSTGNVGIGTTSPGAILQLSRATTNLNLYLTNTLLNGQTWALNSDCNGHFNIHDTNANFLTILPTSGNVGIGTTSPARRLDVYGATGASVDIGLISDIGNHAADYWVFKNVVSDNSLRFLSGGKTWPIDETNSAAMAILYNGNVGIGTTSPAATLQVKGTMKVFGTWAGRSANTVYQAETDGFVLAYTNYDNEDQSLEGYTDSSSSPTTVRVASGTNAEGSTAGQVSIIFPVRKGDYWKVASRVGSTINAVYWLPLGTS